MPNIIDRFKGAWSVFKDPISQGATADRYAYTLTTTSGGSTMPDVIKGKGHRPYRLDFAQI